MPSISSLFLGLIQGLTEFLPISSSGHLVLVSDYINYSSPGIIFETSIHLATTVVVIVYFRRTIWNILLGIQTDVASRVYCLKILLAFFITAIFGYFSVQTIAMEVLQTSIFSGTMLIITGFILISARWIQTSERQPLEWNLSWKTAILIGLAQGISILPGISRSGTTIVAALWMGANKNSAAQFSFLLSIPTILAAAGVGILTTPPLTQEDIGDVIAGSIVAFIFGYIAINWFIRWLQNDRIWIFSFYCWFIGIGSIAIWNLL